MPLDPKNLYLSVDQVAARLGVSRDTIWRWKRNGSFPKAMKLSGRTTRWRLSDIEAWEASCLIGFVAHLDIPESSLTLSLIHI